MSAPDATPARGDVVTGVRNRPEWMGEREWGARCWTSAMVPGGNSQLAVSLVRVFALLDEARSERDALAQRVAALEALSDDVCDDVIGAIECAGFDVGKDERGVWGLQNRDELRLAIRNALRATPTPEAR